MHLIKFLAVLDAPWNITGNYRLKMGSFTGCATKLGKKKSSEWRWSSSTTYVGTSSRSAVKELVFSGVGRSMMEIGVGEVKEVVHEEIFTEDIVIGAEAQNLLCKVQVVAGK